MLMHRQFIVTSLIILICAGVLHAEQPQSISADDFAKLHSMLKPQPGESRWMEIDWYPSIWEARQKAAAEGKPMLMMAGSGGAPVAGC
jgi:hypothetical protein